METFVETNGIRLRVIDRVGGDPVIVCLPGLTANANAFDGYVVAGLAPRFRVVALDLRGRGFSDKLATGYSMPDHAADVLGVLDSLHLDRVVLCGHSFGGLLSMYLAARRPDRISQAILVDAAAQIHPNAVEMIKPALTRLDQTWPSWEDYINDMKQLPYYYDGWWDAIIENWYRSDVQIDAVTGEVAVQIYGPGILEALTRALDVNWMELVKSIHQPVLLINAPAGLGPPGSPPLVSRQQALETVEALPNARYVAVSGHHYTMMFGDGAAQAVEAITGLLCEEDANE
jgi:pimeloyl-ACP methyl ester carboxylesterase